MTKFKSVTPDRAQDSVSPDYSFCLLLYTVTDVLALSLRLTEQDVYKRQDPLFKRFSRAQYMGFKENKNEWFPLPIDEVEGNPYITKNNPGW